MKALMTASLALAMLTMMPYAMAATKTIDGQEVRDWSAVDSNNDGHVSPEEMEAYLELVRKNKSG